MNSAGVRRPVILIVEDDFLIRMNAAEMIADAGFDVIEAGNADEAIVILEARPDIHVVFTDIQMPGSMDGLKLARFVRGRWPPIKIVATSGNFAVRDGDCRKAEYFSPSPTPSTRSPPHLERWWALVRHRSDRDGNRASKLS